MLTRDKPGRPRRRHGTAAALLSIVTAAAFLGVPGGRGAGASTPSPAAGCGTASPNVLAAGATLAAGGCLMSENQRYELVVQADGNVVLYDVAQDDPLWDSGTAGDGVSGLAVQSDGNLVLLSSSGQPLWAAGTPGTPNANLVVQTDGNVVLYGTRGGGSPFAAWATRTENLRGYELLAGDALQPGQSLESQNRQYVLTMNSSGYLVLSQIGSYYCPIWTMPAVVDYDPVQGRTPIVTFEPQNLSLGLAGTGTVEESGNLGGETAAIPGSYLVLQSTDGNLVQYAAPADGWGPSWASGTTGSSGDRAALGTDGNFVVYSATGTALWATGTNDFRGATLCTGSTLQEGQYLAFSSDQHQSSVFLVMQKTCNLVLYETRAATNDGTATLTSTPIWQSGTEEVRSNGHDIYGGCYTVMQDDGNLVIYARSTGDTGVTPLWSSNTPIGSDEPPDGYAFIGPFWLSLCDPYLLLERWGVGTAWKADPYDIAKTVPATANTNAAVVGNLVIWGLNKVLTNNFFNLQKIFETVGWL